MKVKGREITCVLLSLSVTCLVAIPGSRACPRLCACYVSTEVHCTFRYLTSIPDSIPADVERINLGYNSLARLTGNDFYGLKKLELLMLHSNGIHTVTEKTFSDLQALQVLKMSYNKLQKIQKDTFYGLRSLTRLHMDHNSIEFINPEAFYGLTLLRLVHLEGNRLTKLHPDTFVSLSYLQIFKISFLKYLYLSDNFLTSLPEEMVSYMPDLESLYLHGNPWTCDCHLKWLSDWTQGKPDVIKCKKDRNNSSPQQCPLCMNPKIYKGKHFATVAAEAFLCTKPTLDPSLKSKSLPILEDSESASISTQDFMAPLGSLTLNMTDLSGNNANIVCNVQRPSRTLPIAFTEENDYIMLNVSFSTNVICSIDYSHIQAVWQILALYSDSPLVLERKPLFAEAPTLSYEYKQVALMPEETFTSIEADLKADPSWLIQDKISLQLNRTATTLSTLQIQFSCDVQITLPRAETSLVTQGLKWTMILTRNNTKLEHTVVAGGTISLDCPGHGDPSPYLEWLLADGSKVRAPYVSEDGRILIDKNGKLELQMADNFDSGLYHCISTNYADADILTFRITVVEPAVEARHGNEVQQTVFTGETLNLPCHSTGIPDASVSWVLPGNTVLSQSSGDSSDRQILNNGTLRILQVTPKDHGHYRCVAANPSGVDFLTFHVSVQTKGQRPVEHDGEADGSGLEELISNARGKYPLQPLKPSASALTEAEVGNQVSNVYKKSNYWDLKQRWRGDSRKRRFREHRRQFPPSARKIDPRHWAALLEKAKKSTVPEKQSVTTEPLPLAAPLVEIPDEDEDSSGMLSLEESVVPKTKASSVSAKTATADLRPVTHGFVTNITSGTDVSTTVSPQILQSRHLIDFNLPNAINILPVPKNKNSTRTRKMEVTANPNSVTIFPSVPGLTDYPQDAVQVGRREASFQSAYPVTAGNAVTDGPMNVLRSTTNKVDIVVQSVNPTDNHGPQTPATGVSKARTHHIYFHTTQELSTPKPASGSYTAAPPVQIPRNNTANLPFSRRFGRQRKIWGRGRIISPYRTPVLRRHRYGIVRPGFRRPVNRSSAFSATELHEMCPSCPSTENITQTTAALLVLSSSPSTVPKGDVARVITEEPTTVIQDFSLVFKNMQNVDIEKTAATIKYFSTESLHGTDAFVTSTPTSTSLENTLISNNGHPSVSSPSEAEGSFVVTSPPPVPLTIPSTKTSSTKFSRRKIPWNHIFVNNHNQRGIVKNLHQFVLQKNTATVFPKILPVLPTDKGSPSHSTTHSASLMQILSATKAGPQHNATESHSARNLQPGKELPFPPFLPTLPNTTSKSSTTVASLSVETATVAAPTAPASVVIYRTQTSSPKDKKDQIKEPLNKNDRNTTPTQSSGFTVFPAASADTSIKHSISAFTQSPLQDTHRIISTAGLPSGTLSVTGVTEEFPQEHTDTSRSITVSETALFISKSQENITVKNNSAAPAFPSSSEAPLMPVPTSPHFTQSAVKDSEALPVFKMVTNTMATSREASRHSTDPQQSWAEVPTPPEAHPNPELIPSATHYSNMFPSTPVSTLRMDKAQNPKWNPTPWPEKQFQHKSYLETVEEDKQPAVITWSPLSFPEGSAYVLHRDEQKNEKKSGFGEKPVQKPTSELLPSDVLSKNILKRPRITGGKAASFTVPASSDAFLPCEAVGNPLPTIRWTRVSSGLELSQRPQQSRFHVLPNGTLSIQKVSIQDRGQYLCSASNSVGTDRLYVTLSVVSYPPRILERRTNEITFHSGNTVELKCRVEGRPSPTISWILANQTVVSETSKRNRRVLLRPDGALVIRDLSIYDRGLYKCIATNPAGQDSLLVKVQVITAPPLILEQRRQVVAGTSGESLKLPCTAKGTPQPSVHWVLSDGTELKPLQLTHSNLFLYSNGTLYIKDIAPSDSGTYECIATSSSGSERRVVTLTVEKRETVPRIEFASPKWTEMNLGEKLLLNCSATGDPKPRIIWRLPSKAVIDQWHRMGSRIQVYPNGSLFIESATEKDGGDYLCVARNKMGDDVILMHVSLRLTPAKIHHKQHLKKQVLHGKDFQVDCKASGSPVPEISWSLPDGTLINNAIQADDSGHRSKRYTLFHNGTLYFNKVGVAEEGDYTCYAQNTLGKDEMKVRLTVVTATPRIRQGSKTNVRIKAGDMAVLDCEVTGEPKPNVFWLLPSRDIISSSNEKYTIHANESLSINKVKLLDSGEYVCVARNPSGDDSKRYKLDVVSKPPLINGLYTNKTVIKATAVRHSKKHLDCRVDGMPSPQIAWIMPDSILLTAPYYGSRITVHENGTLEIRNVRLSDSADFICVARNEGGESVLVVQLEVLEMLRRPTFRNPFNEKVVAQVGKSTALNCSADGNPPPEIIWILPNGTRFSNGPQNSPYLLASNGSLIIYKMTRNNSGKYRCAARNKVGYIEKLILLESGQKPVILTYAPGMVRGISGESLPLHCVSDGIPKPNVKWTTPSGYVIDRPQVNGKYMLLANGTLVIKEATAYDRGNYICKAQNSVGQAQISVAVTIVAYPPRIINRPPRSMYRKTGVAFQLHCMALGVPKPEITWEMPGQSLLSKTSKGKTQGSENFNPQGTLVIQNPQTSDSGAYKCTAQNPLGSDYATTHIQVI